MNRINGLKVNQIGCSVFTMTRTGYSNHIHMFAYLRAIFDIYIRSSGSTSYLCCLRLPQRTTNHPKDASAIADINISLFWCCTDRPKMCALDLTRQLRTQTAIVHPLLKRFASDEEPVVSGFFSCCSVSVLQAFAVIDCGQQMFTRSITTQVY